VNELGSRLQNEVMMSFKIQCCYLPGVTEDNHERSEQSAYTEVAKLYTTNTYRNTTASYCLE
jgi:hypothetical protein